MTKITDKQKVSQRKYYENNKEKVITRSSEWAKNNPEKRRLKLKEWRNKNPLKDILYKAKDRAKLKGFEFDLCVEDFEPLPTHCPVLGIELTYEKNGRKQSCISLDRFDNSKGYSKENTKLISLRANTLKNNGTIDEFMKVIEYMKSTNA